MLATYTVQQASTAVLGRLGDPAFDSSLLLQFANDENRDICGDAEWPFMQGVFDGTLTVGVAIYNLPSDYQAPIKLLVTDPDQNAIRLKYWPYTRYDNEYPDPTQLTRSMPWMWTTYAQSFIVGPASPDKTYTLRLRYVKEPAELTSVSSIFNVPNAFSEVLVLGILARAQEASDMEDVAKGTWQYRMDKYMRMKRRLLGGPSGEVVSGSWRRRSNVIGDALYGPSEL